MSDSTSVWPKTPWPVGRHLRQPSTDETSDPVHSDWCRHADS